MLGEWITTQGDEMPTPTDTMSSQAVSYIRKNIRTKEIEDENGKRTVYEWEQLALSKEAYTLYQQNEDIAANVDYIAMMTDTDI